MNVKIENGKLIWNRFFKKKELPVSKIVWAYLQQETVNTKMCCGTADFPIGRLIIVKKDMSREVFQYEGMDKPRELLEELKKENPNMEVGYTKENQEKFRGSLT